MTALFPAPDREMSAPRRRLTLVEPTVVSATPPSVPTVTVDLDAVAANTRRLAEATTGELMAVVKADGFGLGAVELAQTALANGAARLGVTGFQDAARLRAAGITAPILTWLHAPDADYALARTLDLEVAVPSVAHLAELVIRAPGTRVHLQLDTGLARDGAAPQTWRSFFRQAANLERAGLITVAGLMGHLPAADDLFGPSNATGRARFLGAQQLARRYGLRPQQCHLAATDATLNDPLSHFTMSRCGAGIVGATAGLRGVVTLTAPIAETRRVPAGTPVGYGHTWIAPEETTLALVPVGYADGLPRIAGTQASVLVGGERRPVVGRISMDMTVVDLGSQRASLGATVTILGPGNAGEPTVHEWAAWAGTLPHEILTGFGPRLRRTYVGAGR